MFRTTACSPSPMYVVYVRTFITRVYRLPRHRVMLILLRTADCMQFLIIHVTLRANPFLYMEVISLKSARQSWSYVASPCLCDWFCGNLVVGVSQVSTFMWHCAPTEVISIKIAWQSLSHVVSPCLYWFGEDLFVGVSHHSCGIERQPVFIYGNHFPKSFHMSLPRVYVTDFAEIWFLEFLINNSLKIAWQICHANVPQIYRLSSIVHRPSSIVYRLGFSTCRASSRDNVRGENNFRAKWRLSCLLFFEYSSQHAHFWKSGNILFPSFSQITKN